MRDFLFTLSSTAWLLCILGYILCSILEKKEVQDKVLNLWVKVEENTLWSLKKSFLLASDLIHAIYEKANGRVSKKKLLIISFLLNGSTIIGFLNFEIVKGGQRISPSEAFFNELGDELYFSGLLILLFLLIIIIFISSIQEFVSYKITQYFIQKGCLDSEKKYFKRDIITLVFLMYLLPILLWSIIIGFQYQIDKGLLAIIIAFTILFFSSSLPLFYIVLSLDFYFLDSTISNSSVTAEQFIPNIYSLLLFIPGAFSVCLPTVLFAYSMSNFGNKKTRRFLNVILEFVSKRNITKLKNQFAFIATIALAIISIVSYK